MSRARMVHRCQACGWTSLRWTGKCGGCDAWNSLAEQERPTHSGAPASGSVLSREVEAVSLRTVNPEEGRPTATGVDELDRVLTGGLRPGSVTLVGGEPGVGKSTLLLQVLLASAGTDGTVLLVSAEESPAQVLRRAQRLGDVAEELLIVATLDAEDVEAAVSRHRPRLVVVDSIQTVSDAQVRGGAGSPVQVRACAERFIAMAKREGAAVVLVGHVTKDGGLAGPRVLEHLVDTVLSLEGDRHHALRTLRAVKHRFGPTGEVGLFELGPGGMEGMSDPERLLENRWSHVPGTVVLPLLQGRRALLVEVQALVTPTEPTTTRPDVIGLDPRRLTLLSAVLRHRVGINTGHHQVYASIASGVRATEPAADLPLSLALASTMAEVPVAQDLVAFGEVGLAGEVREVPRAQERLAEAARLGFRRAVVPASTPGDQAGISLIRVRDLSQAIETVFALSGVTHARSTGPMDQLLEHRAPKSRSPGGRRFGPAFADGEMGTMPGWSTVVTSR